MTYPCPHQTPAGRNSCSRGSLPFTGVTAMGEPALPFNVRAYRAQPRLFPRSTEGKWGCQAMDRARLRTAAPFRHVLLLSILLVTGDPAMAQPANPAGKPKVDRLVMGLIT